MTITYGGLRSYDPQSSSFHFEVFIDGIRTACTLEKDVLDWLCNDSSDPLDTFDTCRLAILSMARKTYLHDGEALDHTLDIRKSCLDLDRRMPPAATTLGTLLIP